MRGGNFPSAGDKDNITIRFSSDFDLDNPNDLASLRQEIWRIYMELALLSIYVRVLKDPDKPQKVAGKPFYRPNLATSIVNRGTTNVSPADFLGWSWQVNGKVIEDSAKIKEYGRKRRRQIWRIIDKITRVNDVWKRVYFNFKYNPVPSGPDNRVDLKTSGSNRPGAPQGTSIIIDEPTQHNWRRWLKVAVEHLIQKGVDLKKEMETQSDREPGGIDPLAGKKREIKDLIPRAKIPTGMSYDDSGKLIAFKEEISLLDMIIALGSHGDNYILIAGSTGSAGFFLPHYQHPTEPEGVTCTVLALSVADPAGAPSRVKSETDKMWWVLYHELIHAYTPLYDNEYMKWDWWQRYDPNDYVSRFYDLNEAEKLRRITSIEE